MLTSPYPVPPSRLWLTIRAAAYALIAISGIAVLATPPASYSGLSNVLTAAWGPLPPRWRADGLWRDPATVPVGMVALLDRRHRGRNVRSPLVASGPRRRGRPRPRALLMTALVLMLLSRAIQLGLIDLGARRIAELRSTDD